MSTDFYTEEEFTALNYYPTWIWDHISDCDHDFSYYPVVARVSKRAIEQFVRHVEPDKWFVLESIEKASTFTPFSTTNVDTDDGCFTQTCLNQNEQIGKSITVHFWIGNMKYCTNKIVNLDIDLDSEPKSFDELFDLAINACISSGDYDKRLSDWIKHIQERERLRNNI